VAAEAVRLGHVVVSGGAVGCDRAAASGTPRNRLIEILPCGLDLRPSGRGCQLTVCAPDEEFCTGTAMERNALIYAASDFTFVGEARFREGGTWTGAVEAHRRSLCRLLVREDEHNQALRALTALGAVPLASAAGLEVALSATEPQRRLFGDTVAERRAVSYAAA
jgi:predicted Rossmann fold nucleotide-binding protein DprA/Smf involved in DNA uptake